MRATQSLSQHVGITATPEFDLAKIKVIRTENQNIRKDIQCLQFELHTYYYQLLKKAIEPVACFWLSPWAEEASNKFASRSCAIAINALTWSLREQKYVHGS